MVSIQHLYRFKTMRGYTAMQEYSFNTTLVSVQVVLKLNDLQFIFCFNTTLVSVQEDSVAFASMDNTSFQYNTCIGSSIYTHPLCNFFIVFQYNTCIGSRKALENVKENPKEFQYNTCIGSSSSRRHYLLSN